MDLKKQREFLRALFRIGLREMTVYRAEVILFVLSTTMPLVMLPLWHAVAEEAPVVGFGKGTFTAYFLCAFFVRQVTAAWVSWTMNYEIKQGTFSSRLLKPVHPLWFYMVENISGMPLRLVIAVPVLVFGLWSTGEFTRDPKVMAMVIPSLLAA